MSLHSDTITVNYLNLNTYLIQVLLFPFTSFIISLKIENASNTFFRNCNMRGPTVYVFLFASNI